MSGGEGGSSAYPFPFILNGQKLEPSDLKYKVRRNWTTFYGFHKDCTNLVVAVHESNWAVILFKPYYNRFAMFSDFNATGEDISSISAEGLTLENWYETLTRRANREERLANFFDRPYIRKAKRQMIKLLDLRGRNAGGYIAEFKRCYG